MERAKVLGFSLIEVLIGCVVLGLLAMAFVQFLGNASRGQKSVQNLVDVDILKSSLNLLTHSKGCDGAFQDTSNQAVQLNLLATPPATGNVLAAPLAVQKVVFGGSPLIEHNAKIGGGLQITTMEIPYAEIAGPVQVVGGVNYQPYLLRFRWGVTKSAGSLGTPIATQEFLVRMLANQSPGPSLNRLEFCQNQSAAAGAPPTSAVWVNMPAGDNCGGSSPPCKIKYAAGVDARPSKICADQGYTTYSGACRATKNGDPVEGSIVSIEEGSGTNRKWSIGCRHGGDGIDLGSLVIQCM